MKRHYNKLQFIKGKQINEINKQQYIWKISWSRYWEKLCFLRNTLGKIPEVATERKHSNTNSSNSLSSSSRSPISIFKHTISSMPLSTYTFPCIQSFSLLYLQTPKLQSTSASHPLLQWQKVFDFETLPSDQILSANITGKFLFCSIIWDVKYDLGFRFLLLNMIQGFVLGC